MANNAKKGTRGGNQGQSNRRDDDDRSQRMQGRGDREQQGNGREGSGRAGSKQGGGAASGGGRNKKGNSR